MIRRPLARRPWAPALAATAVAVATLAAMAPVPASAAASPAPYPTWGAVADGLPEQLLGATPTPADHQATEAALTSGATAPGQVVADLRTTSDQTQVVDPAVRLYRAFFLRIPDKTGLEYWIRNRRTGHWSLVRMAAQFAGSSEFTRRYGDLTNRDFIKLIYDNVLERPYDPGGLDYWTRQLDTKRRDRGTVMVGFSESNEYKAAQTSEVTTAVLWILMVGRAPTQAEFDADVAALDGGLSVADYATRLMALPDYAAQVAKRRIAIFGDSVPYELVRDGSPGTDLSATTLVNAGILGCDGAADGPPARWRLGGPLPIDAGCTAGWPVLYPPNLAIHPDLSVLMVGPHAMLDHLFDGVWKHPCSGTWISWYRNDIEGRLRYLRSVSDEVALVLPAWPGPNSIWIMPNDYVARADCVRDILTQAASATGTPTVDLASLVCPSSKTDCLPYRVNDGVHIDVDKAPEVLTWLLHQLP